MNENPQNSIKEKPKKKRAGIRAKLLFENYEGNFTEKDIHVLSALYREWADEGESLILDEFQQYINKDDSTFSKMRAAWPVLDDAHKYAKRAIAIRRERGALLGQFRDKIFMHNQHQYSENWNEANKYWAKLKAESEAEALLVAAEKQKSLTEKRIAEELAKKPYKDE